MSLRTVRKEIDCVEEECQLCFNFNELICQYYNHRVCYDCWVAVVEDHTFQELGLDQLIFNKDFKFNQDADTHSSEVITNV